MLAIWFVPFILMLSTDGANQMIFTNQVKQNPKTKAKFAPGKDIKGYKVYKLCSNYDGKVRGGIRHSWCLVADGLSLAQAKLLLNKKCGIKIYDDIE